MAISSSGKVNAQLAQNRRRHILQLFAGLLFR